MIGRLYYAYNDIEIAAVKLLSKELIIDYVYNEKSYRPDMYREVDVGPQTTKYYFYAGTEQAGYYFSTLPFKEAMKLIRKDVKKDMERFLKKYDR